MRAESPDPATSHPISPVRTPPTAMSQPRGWSHRRIAIVVASAVIATGAVAGVLLYAASFVTVYGSAVATGPAAGYFTVKNCNLPVTVAPGSHFTCAITLTNNDATSTHVVTGVSVSGPVTLVSAYPGPPVDVAPFNSLSLSVTVQLPPSGGGLSMVIAVATAM